MSLEPVPRRSSVIDRIPRVSLDYGKCLVWLARGRTQGRPSGFAQATISHVGKDLGTQSGLVEADLAELPASEGGRNSDKNVDQVWQRLSNVVVVEEKSPPAASLEKPRSISEWKYNRYSRATRMFAAAVGSISGILIPLGSMIIYPSLPVMTIDLNTTSTLLNFSITLYFVVMGISPLFWSPLSDSYGRRIVMFSAVSFYCVGSLVIATAVHDIGFFYAMRGKLLSRRGCFHHP